MNVRSLIVILALVTSINALSQSNQVPDNIEFHVLKDLFDSLGGPSWTNKNNWPTAGNWPPAATSVQFATWYGVTVTNGDITSINLSNNNLQGQLPFRVGNLATLTTLQLDVNRIKGPIPSSIGNLHALRMLNLSYNNFSGTLPDFFDNMRDLRDLRLTNTQVSGSLPSSIGFPGSKLYRLLMNNNKFNGPIPSTWNNLRALMDLELAFNELTGELPSFIGDWTSLSILDIRNNKFTGAIPSSIGNLTLLGGMNISNNRFSGDFPSSISTSGVYYIIASNNYFVSLPASLLSRPALTTVYFDNNDLVSVPDFGSYSNRANLALKIENNRLDLSQLE